MIVEADRRRVDTRWRLLTSFTSFIIGSGLSLASSAFASPQPTQGLREAAPAILELPVGIRVAGTLGPNDPSSRTGYYDTYRLRLTKGQAVEIDMKSEDIDAFLDISFDAPTRGKGSPAANPLLFQNDDFGDSTDARLRITTPFTGYYIVRAQGLSGGTGSYSISVKEIRAARPQVRVLAVGKSSGNFVTVAGEYPEESVPYDVYNFSGRVGERVRIAMASAAFDPQLKLSLEGDGESLFQLSNDDSGRGTDATITAVLPTTGNYRLLALNGSQTPGAYTLDFQRADPQTQAIAPAELSRAQPMRERFALDGADTNLLVRGAGEVYAFYKTYRLQLMAGEKVTIDLEADDPSKLDVALEAGLASSLGFASALQNDDIGRGNRNARLVLMPTESGEILLRARSLQGGLGGFTLRVAEAPAVAAPTPRP